MLKVTVFVGLFSILCGCAAQTKNKIESLPEEAVTPILSPLETTEGTYWVDLPHQKGLSFFGQRKLNKSNSRGESMMYPGGNAGTLLAAIAIHAAFQASATTTKKQAEMAEANKVLVPYRALIEELSLSDLIPSTQFSDWELGHPRLNMKLVDESVPFNGWHTVVNPVFIMSRNQDSIIIKSEISIIDSRLNSTMGTPEPSYSRTIYIHESPLYDQTQWLAEGGEYFESTVASLLRSSIILGINDFSGFLPEKEAVASTIRYPENGVKKVERGYLIQQSCSHTVFESLRGDIKSVPRFNYQNNEYC